MFFYLLLVVSACNSGEGAGIRLSGTIRMPGHTAVDSDVNDAWESAPQPQSNNGFSDAQDLSMPVILGGFVTTAGSPACAYGGRLCADGDPSDFYKIALSGNQTITLYVADSALQAHLYLYDSSRDVIDSVTTSASSMTLSISAATGEDYYVEVRAVEGASNYTLTIAGNASTTSVNGSSVSDRSALNMSQAFRPGELIVRFKQDQGYAKTPASSILKAQALGFTVVSRDDSGPILVKMQADKKPELFKKLGLNLINHSISGNILADDELRAKSETIQLVQAMRRRPDVSYAEPNYIRQAAVVPNDRYYDLQWHYPLIHLPEAWDLLSTGVTPVVVAVVDTGVLMNHPDLSGQLTSDGFDFISNPEMANDGDGIDANPDDPGDLIQNGLSSFHGTHVSGVIAAATDNDTGVAGVTWRTGTQIMPLRALGVGGGTSYDMIQALRYAAGLENDSGTVPSKIADVVNLSIGGSTYSAAEAEVLNQVRNAGIIIVAAAGNGADSAPSYPAAYDGVISVSAVDINAELAYYSNFGEFVDVAAPGGDNSNNLNGDSYPDGVLSTLGDDSSASVQYSYAFSEGTSMATPHVAGVAALMKSVKPDLMPDDFEAFLINGNLTVDIGAEGKDPQFGYGLIDAYNAVYSAKNNAIPTVLRAWPAGLNFGADQTALPLTVQMLGQGELSVTGISIDGAWVTITPSTASFDLDAAQPTAGFTVQVNRPNDFLDGLYTGSITFEADTNIISVPVSMQKSSSDQTSDAGFHYIVLLDPNTSETKYMKTATVRNGQYVFQFDDVAAGSYILIAGTDMDNDGFVGEEGEALGIYSSKDQPSIIEISDSVSGLDFYTGFTVNLSTVLSGAGLLPADEKDERGRIPTVKKIKN